MVNGIKCLLRSYHFLSYLLFCVCVSADAATVQFGTAVLDDLSTMGCIRPTGNASGISTDFMIFFTVETLQSGMRLVIDQSNYMEYGVESMVMEAGTECGYDCFGTLIYDWTQASPDPYTVSIGKMESIYLGYAETSAEERCNEILKAAERSWMEHHPNGTDSELADFKKRMAKSVETTSGEVVSSDKVTIHETFDFGNVVLFFMRTAYELACYTHGSEYYLNSPTAAELRRAIMNKDPGAKIHGQVMPSDAEARCLFSIIDKDKYNYAILMGGFAFISILGITGIIQYDDKGGRFSIPVECAPLLLFEVAKDSNLRRPAMITTFVDYITRNSVDRDMALRNLDLGLFGDQQQ